MDYKPKDPGVRSSIFLPVPLHTWVEAEAKRNNTTSAEVIRAAIRELKLKVEKRATAAPSVSRAGVGRSGEQ